MGPQIDGREISSSPQSCDTFVVLSDCTKGGHVIFGKNSDRPSKEVQEVVYVAANDHIDGTKLQCTYIEIDQLTHTHAVILSKPSWMWGAEMGSNEHGVCIGNEAVWTKTLGDDDKTEKLLGMDLLRLGLERSITAEEAVDVISSLLETHGQGGLCSDTEADFYYHNSFLIADAKEAWVLETAGSLWAAERITSGYRNISNCLSIGTKFDKSCSDLEERSKSIGCWDGSSEFNFAKVFELSDDDPDSRKICGDKLLAKLSEGGGFTLTDMFTVLRDTDSGICRGVDHKHPTTSSMVSVLVSSSDNGRPNCHWLTGTPDPQRSVFKPFIFTPHAKISPFIQSKKVPPEEDPAKVVPRFVKPINRGHVLYNRHQTAMSKNADIVDTLRELESNCVKETEIYLQNFDPERLHEVDDLFKDCVDSELKFYMSK